MVMPQKYEARRSYRHKSGVVAEREAGFWRCLPELRSISGRHQLLLKLHNPANHPGRFQGGKAIEDQKKRLKLYGCRQAFQRHTVWHAASIEKAERKPSNS
jgi:hypothetical protein